MARHTRPREAYFLFRSAILRDSAAVAFSRQCCIQSHCCIECALLHSVRAGSDPTSPAGPDHVHPPSPIAPDRAPSMPPGTPGTHPSQVRSCFTDSCPGRFLGSRARMSCATLLEVDPGLSLIHISEPTRLLSISYAVFCLKKK